MKESFILYQEQQEIFNALTDEQAGRLIKTIFEYCCNDEKATVKVDEDLKLIFIPIRQQLDRASKKYEAVCEKRRLAGSKGGKQTQANAKNDVANQANATFASNNQANQADNDNDNDNDNDLILSYESIKEEEKKEGEQNSFSTPKKIDPFVLAEKVKEEYKQVIEKDCFLNQPETEKLYSLYIATPDFFETLNSVMWQLKALQDTWKKPKPIGLGFSPPFSWLLKENFKNYSDIRNGVYDEVVAKWRKEYRLRRSQELAEQLMKEEQSEVCYG